MKKFYRLFFAATALAAFFSCQEVTPDEGGNEGTVDAPHASESDVYCEQYPINWSENIAEGSEVGVSIEVTDISNENFKFVLRPGAMIQSYRMDVYPLSILYNRLLNDKMAGKDEFEISEKIRSYIYNAEGNGGYTFTINDDGEDNFFEKTFDWANTTFARASAVPVPNADYIIAVVACTDIEASETAQQELTLCHVRTTASELIGNPRVDIKPEVDYRMFRVNYEANQDCKYCYYFTTQTEQVDEYIDAFGDKMFIDFLRAMYSSPYDTSDQEQMYEFTQFDQTPDTLFSITSAVIACDANKTPAAMYSRNDFTLKEVPEEVEEIAVKVTVDESRVSCNYFEFDAEFSATCHTMYYRVYEKDEAEWIMNSERNTANERLDISGAYGGYGVKNPNYVPADSSASAAGKVREISFGEYEAGKSYYIGYVGRDRYGLVSDLYFSEMFTMDERITTNPELCKSDLKLSLSEPTRTGFRITVEYDPDNTSMVYLQYYTPDNQPDCVGGTQEEWLDFIFTPGSWNTGGYSPVDPNMNIWPRVESGRDGWAYYGFKPNTTIGVFAVAEDFDGNVSEVLIEEITTCSAEPGPDPTMEVIVQEGLLSNWEMSCTIVKDVATYKACTFDSHSDLADFINTTEKKITSKDFKDMKNSQFTYEEWETAISLYGTTLGMESEDDSSVPFNKSFGIGVCIAQGVDANGENVYKTYIVVQEKGVGYTLEEYFNK